MLVDPNTLPELLCGGGRRREEKAGMEEGRDAELVRNSNEWTVGPAVESGAVVRYTRRNEVGCDSVGTTGEGTM